MLNFLTIKAEFLSPNNKKDHSSNPSWAISLWRVDSKRCSKSQFWNPSWAISASRLDSKWCLKCRCLDPA